jgi:hypothetical protein|tara:strand:- start:151 stop:336 length:186 start_codon:yes stop_codon:yes gene_type:complete
MPLFSPNKRLFFKVAYCSKFIVPATSKSVSERLFRGKNSKTPRDKKAAYSMKNKRLLDIAN